MNTKIKKKMENKFIKNYFDRYRDALKIDVENKLIESKNVILNAKQNNRKIIIVGNGGSSAIASHAIVDFTKQGGVRAVNFNDPALITCFANDYGYEKWLKKAVEFYADDGDVLIAISSSGNSENIVQAIETANNMALKVITFSGFDKNNRIKQLGDVNFWLDSCAYNIVENMHQIWLLAICDLIIGNAVYKA
jgi:D-sedoheptulose 7-phosphate isomerase